MDLSLRAWCGAALIAAPLGWFAVAEPFEAHAQRQRARQKPVLAPFVGSLEDARRSALERNVPLLIHVILEGEPENDAYRDQILPDGALIEASERAVVIVANNGEHPLATVRETVEDRTIERQVCSVYRLFETCAQHRANWDPIYFEYHDPDGQMRCPQTILLSPTGGISWRRNDGNPPPASDVTSALRKAQKEAGPGLTAAELVEARRAIGTAQFAERENDHARALQSYGAVLERIQAGPVAEEAAAGSQRVLELLTGRLEAAKEQLVPGSACAALRALIALDRAATGTPLEREVKNALRAAERNRELQDEIRACKLEMEAEELWAEAQQLFEKGDARRGELAVRRLLRRKYQGTDVARLAREKYPEWAAEEESRGG